MPRLLLCQALQQGLQDLLQQQHSSKSAPRQLQAARQQ
jgi:hypothetical protein